MTGSSGTVLGHVAFYGNWARSKVTFSATDGSGVVVPEQTVEKEGKTGSYPCMGDKCWAVFELKTTVAVDLKKSCGVTLASRGTHTALWTALPTEATSWLGQWGEDFSADAIETANNGTCTCSGGGGGGGGDDPPPPDMRSTSNGNPNVSLSVSGCGSDGGGGDEPSVTYVMVICSYRDYYDPYTYQYLYSVAVACRYEVYEA